MLLPRDTGLGLPKALCSPGTAQPLVRSHCCPLLPCHSPVVSVPAPTAPSSGPHLSRARTNALLLRG